MPSNQFSKLAPLIIGIVLVCLLTGGVAAYSGTLTGRWIHFRGYGDAQKLLRELPLQIEDWEAEKEGTLVSGDVSMLEIENGYVTRVYKNTNSQQFVNFTMMVGKTGKISVHTPEICFGGKNYDKENTRTVVTIPIADQRGDENGPIEDSFWKVNFVSKSSQKGTISFYYGISVGKAWEAHEDPRSVFRRYRYAYKLQAEAVADENSDVLKQFLIDCLPTIHKHMRDCE